VEKVNAFVDVRQRIVIQQEDEVSAQKNLTLCVIHYKIYRSSSTTRIIPWKDSRLVIGHTNDEV
jgi:hypothetical protein